MSDKEDPSRKYEADVFRRLEACGVRRENIELVYQDYLRDYEILINEGPLARDQIECIVDAVDASGVLDFRELEDARVYMDVARQKARASLVQQAAAMPDLPVFDPEKQSLSEFLREIEVYCGVAPGSVLEVADGKVVRVRPSIPISELKEALKHSRVMGIAVLALAAHMDIAIGVVGGT